MSEDQIDDVFAKKVSEVHLVSARDGDRVTGLIAASAMRVSHSKVVVSVRKGGLTQQYISKGRVFAINILGKDQVHLVKRFAFFTGGDGEKFEGVPYTTKATGCPIITGSVGYLDCRVLDSMDCGDHLLFLGEIADASLLKDGSLLRSSDLADSQEYQKWRAEWYDQLQKTGT